MKYFFIVPVLLIFIIGNANAKTTDFRKSEVYLMYDGDEYFFPEFNVGFSWSENSNFYSGLGYQKKISYKDQAIEGFAESRSSTTIEENKAAVNLVSWCSDKNNEKQSNINFSAGLLAEYIMINRKEFGYAQLDPTNNGPWMAADNQVDIEMIRPCIVSSLGINAFDDIFNLLFHASVSPSGRLKVEQETYVKPLVNEAGISSHSISQVPAYSMGLNLTINTRLPADIIIGYDYEYFPVKYKVALLRQSSAPGSYLFATEEVENNETITSAEIKLRFTKEISTLNPVIGYKYEKIKTSDKNEQSESDTNNYFIIGFENKF